MEYDGTEYTPEHHANVCGCGRSKVTVYLDAEALSNPVCPEVMRREVAGLPQLKECEG